MAKIGDIVQAAASVTGVPDKTVKETAKQAKFAQHIKAGSSGRYGGAEMDSMDGGALILGLMAPGPMAAPEFITEVGGLVSIGISYPEETAEYVARRLGLPWPHTLLQAIAAIIDRHMDGTISEIVQPDIAGKLVWFVKDTGLDLEMVLELPATIAQIKFGVSKDFLLSCPFNAGWDADTMPDREEFVLDYYPKMFREAREAPDAEKRNRINDEIAERIVRRSEADLETTKKVSARTFSAIAATLAKD